MTESTAPEQDGYHTVYASCRRIARQPIAYGTLVRHDHEGCDPTDFAGMTGIAKRGGSGEHRWEAGELVLIMTDGEIRVDLDEPIDLVVGGVLRRLQARQPVMVLLERGKIVGGW